MKAVPNLRWTHDPFAAAFMPPPDETDDERAQRVHEQAEAARVSREIDEDLQETKKLIEKRKKAIKVLLLGKPSSSPPPPAHSLCPKVKPSPARAPPSRVSIHILSVTRYLPSHDWRRLPALLLSFSIQTGEGCLEIGHPAQSHQVNSCPAPLSHSHPTSRSVRTMLQVIQDDWENIGPVKPTSPTPGFSRQNGSILGSPTFSNQRPGDEEDSEPILTDVHRHLRMRLSPLISMEENLTKKLFPHPPDPKEISVRGGTNWKSYLARVAKEKQQRPARPRSSQGTIPQEEGTHILVTFKEDIIALWSDPAVHRVLKRRKCNIRDMPGLCVPSFSSKSEI